MIANEFFYLTFRYDDTDWAVAGVYNSDGAARVAEQRLLKFASRKITTRIRSDAERPVR